VARKSKVLRTPASVRYWVTASQTKKSVARAGSRGCRDIGEVLGLDIDGHQGDIGGYPAEELGQSRPLAVDVGGEIDFVDRRCGQDGQSVGPRVEARPQNHRGIDLRVGGLR
jgi:hypothetical protein